MNLFGVSSLLLLSLICPNSQGLRIDFNPHNAITSTTTPTTTTSTTTTPSPLALAPNLSDKCLKVFRDCRASCFLFSCSKCYSLVIGCAFDERFPSLNKPNVSKVVVGSPVFDNRSNSSVPVLNNGDLGNSTTNKARLMNSSNTEGQNITSGTALPITTTLPVTTTLPIARSGLNNTSDSLNEGSGLAESTNISMEGSGLAESTNISMEGSGFAESTNISMEGSGFAETTDISMEGSGFAEIANISMGSWFMNIVNTSTEGSGFANHSSEIHARKRRNIF